MSSRFVSNIVFMIAGGVVVVFSQAIRPGVTSWITFGIGLGVLAVIGLTQLDRNRGRVQQALDALCGLLALEMVVVSAVYVGHTVMWSSFGEGLALAALALAGLVVHELSTERVVHSLAIAEERPSSTYAEAA